MYSMLRWFRFQGDSLRSTKKAEEQIAEDFQSRFLGYFLRNFNSVQTPNFDISGLALPVQTLARALGAAVIGDSELQAKILPLLKIQDEEIRADRARTCDAVVLEALLFFIQAGGWSKVRTDNIAEKVGAIYKGRGSDQQPSAETVGWAIRRLGIPSGRINRAGNGVELDVGVCRLVHRLALCHGVRAMTGGPRWDSRTYIYGLGATTQQAGEFCNLLVGAYFESSCARDRSGRPHPKNQNYRIKPNHRGYANTG